MSTTIVSKPGKPFLKWAGGKSKLADRIKELLPDGKRLIEPFVGSAAVFLNTNYSRYLLNDNNPDLINLYKIIQSHGHEFFDYVESFFGPKFNKENIFYERREEFNCSHDPMKKAALFIYLNRHGFNGLCRYNSSGKFNVPFGRYHQPLMPRKALENFYLRAKNASFVCSDFSKVMAKAKVGDIIYCDPPYVPLSKTGYFTKYSHDDFSLAQQQTLVECAKKAAACGIPVLISNHDTELSQLLYAEAKINKLSVKRSISCKANSRGKVNELLVLYD